MNGVQHYLWRAVDQNGAVIDILVQPRRDPWAALRLFRQQLYAAERRPRVIITDKLRSYAAAKRLVLPKTQIDLNRSMSAKSGDPRSAGLKSSNVAGHSMLSSSFEKRWVDGVSLSPPWTYLHTWFEKQQPAS